MVPDIARATRTAQRFDRIVCTHHIQANATQVVGFVLFARCTSKLVRMLSTERTKYSGELRKALVLHAARHMKRLAASLIAAADVGAALLAVATGLQNGRIYFRMKERIVVHSHDS